MPDVTQLVCGRAKIQDPSYLMPRPILKGPNFITWNLVVAFAKANARLYHCGDPRREKVRTETELISLSIKITRGKPKGGKED